MITKEKLLINLDILRRSIPQKPLSYTPDYPKNLKEAIHKYCNQRSVNAVQMATQHFGEQNWPLPLWVDPENIRIGFWNKYHYKKFYYSWKNVKPFSMDIYTWYWAPMFRKMFYNCNFDDSILQAFESNLRYIQNKLQSNNLLELKKPLIDEVFVTYKRQHYLACISTLFPLLDFISRKFFKTKRLTVDVGVICKLFQQIGFGLDNFNRLMPHVFMMNTFQQKFEKKISHEEYEKQCNSVIENDFGLIGAALSSFLQFANHYYGYYKEDGEESNIINRHAIIHGSVSYFGNRVNAVKLITFLYLMLELEPALVLLLNDE